MDLLCQQKVACPAHPHQGSQGELQDIAAHHAAPRPPPPKAAAASWYTMLLGSYRNKKHVKAEKWYHFE